MKILSLLFAVSLCIPAWAQLRIGPEVGVNASGYSSSGGGRQVMGCFRAGLQADIALAGRFHLNPGILYVRNDMGGSHLIGVAPSTMRIGTIEVPLQLLYRAKEAKVTTPFVGGGLYMSIHVDGHTTIYPGEMPHPLPVINRSLRIGNDVNDDIKTFDAGLSLTAGMLLANGLNVRVLLQKGFVNLQPQSGDNYLRRFNLGFSLGYLFHRKHTAKEVKQEATNAAS